MKMRYETYILGIQRSTLNDKSFSLVLGVKKVITFLKLLKLNYFNDISSLTDLKLLTSSLLFL